MIVKCEKSGSREKCEECFHSREHVHRHNLGCDSGQCYPSIKYKIGEEYMGEILKEEKIVTPNYNCLEVKNETK